MVVKKIMVVGGGGVGSRHLQALCKMEIPVRLFAVDPNEESLQKAEILVNEIGFNKNIESIKFSKELPTDIDEIDLFIISTSSNVRLNVLKHVI